MELSEKSERALLPRVNGADYAFWLPLARKRAGNLQKDKLMTYTIEKANNYQRAYRKLHREARANAARVYRAKNPQRILANRQQWYRKNRTIYLAKKRERYKTNRVARDQKNRQHSMWRRGNPDKVKIYRRISEHRRRVAHGRFTTHDWLLLTARSFRCHWCHRRWTTSRRPTRDHVIPLSKGGENSLENSVCACRECNTLKGVQQFHPATGQGILL